MSYTSCDGVMSAEAILENPAVFHPTLKLGPDYLAKEYISFFKKYPHDIRCFKQHLFVFSHTAIKDDPDLNQKLFESKTLEEFESVFNLIS